MSTINYPTIGYENGNQPSNAEIEANKEAHRKAVEEALLKKWNWTV